MTTVLEKKDPDNPYVIQTLVFLMRQADTEQRELFSFEKMEEVAGVDITENRWRQCLYDAFKILEANYNKNFKSVRGVGYEAIPEGEVPSWGRKSMIGGVKQKAKTMKRRMNTVRYDHLTDKQKGEYQLAGLQYQAVVHSVSDETQTKLKSFVPKDFKQGMSALSPGMTLDFSIS